MTKVLTYVEIDIDFCSLTYGVSPCMAVLETGGEKCFNSIATCQDRENFTNEPVTLRFGMSAVYYPREIEHIPSLVEVAVTPGIVSLGKDLGQRATIVAHFTDHRWSDTGPGFDKYREERSYDPYTQGTFFGKFRARQPFLRGRPFRLIRGLVGQTLAEMETRYYVIESFNGPDVQGHYSITAKDVLKLADGDRAQAPVLSQGFLVSAITDVDVSATLSPAGIGNLEYAAAGHVAIGGSEIAAYTRAGDVLTLTRGQLGTTAVAHDAEERAQEVLRYVGQDPAYILSDLLENYAGVLSEFIPLTAWQTEVDTHLLRVYTATIPEPTSVAALISELIEQAALAMWWDDRDQVIRLQVLRAIPTASSLYDPERIMEGSLQISEQPDTRISQVWTYFGMRNPLEGVNNPDNYRSTALTVDLEAEDDYGTPAIKRIFSRWIPTFGRTVADRLNDLLLSRYRDPPRRFSFDLIRYSGDVDPLLGGGYRIEDWPLQDATGAQVFAPIQLTRLNPIADRFSVEAEEVLVTTQDAADLTDRQITIDVNTLNLNLREVHDSLFPVIEDPSPTGVNLTCTISEGVIVGSASTGAPAFDVGEWPAGLPITLVVHGRIQGHGGDGGDGGSSFPHGFDGGAALFTDFPIDLDNTDGEIWSGGGGGAGRKLGGDVKGGGGGAGQIPGNGGRGQGGDAGGDPGTTEAGGHGPGIAANGGDPGQSGGDAGSNNGGDPGKAIDGVSFVTVIGSGDIRGPQVN